MNDRTKLNKLFEIKKYFILFFLIIFVFLKLFTMNTLIEALMNRDGIDHQEAAKLVKEMQTRVNDGEDPEEVLYEDGLEPDYIFDLISF